MRRLFALLLLLAASACAGPPQEANPALWRIDGPGGQQGWLFGTIHALPRPVDWRTPKVDGALGQATSIVVEVGNLSDDAAMAQVFSEMARSPGLPPLDQRLPAQLQAPLALLLGRGKLAATAFSDVETWAAALTLARVDEGAQDASRGIDRAVIAAAGRRPIIELEGVRGQLMIFDRLPETEQRDLLALVINDADNTSAKADAERMADAWRTGRMDVIEGETRRGLLADPELREALYSSRNRAWAARIAAMLAAGQQPFVAVGAAHMAGSDGLPILLEPYGLRVTRIQ